MSAFLRWIVGAEEEEKEWTGKKTFEGSGPNSAGSTYEGDWLGEKKHGFGEWRSNDGLAWYKGEWKENKRHGEGEFHWASGAWYRGHWRNGVKHGHGEYHGEDGGLFKGEFFDNEKHGEGVEHWPDGSWYKGKWRNNQRHGDGEYHWASGAWYKGGHYENVREGEGSLFGADGKLQYKGEWSNGKGHGTGEYHWGDGHFHQGVYVHGKAEGQGTYHWPDGATYSGLYSKGQRQASGVYVFPDGRVFEGELPRADLICLGGAGTMKFPDDGREASGRWDRASLRSKPDRNKPSVTSTAKFSGSGTISWPQSTRRYEGEWVDGVPHGLGKLTHEDGSVDSGSFINGQFVPDTVDSTSPKHEAILDFTKVDSDHKPTDSAPPPPETSGAKAGSGGTMEVDEGNHVGGSEAAPSTPSGAPARAMSSPPKLTEPTPKRLEQPGLKWVEYHGEDGTFYRGQVEDDKAEGYGEYRAMNGDHYVGQWHEGEKCGEGKLVTVDGSWYHGMWKNDVGHGEGTYHWSDGSWYTGGWKHDKLHGYGEFHWAEGSAYVGKYDDGRRVGMGTYTFDDGRSFTGDMTMEHSMTIQGKGTMTYPDGRLVEGLWSRTLLRKQPDRTKPSTPSEETPSGKGKIVWTDGSTYDGPHLDGVPHGAGGCFVAADGGIQQGDFFYGACEAPKIKEKRRLDDLKTSDAEATTTTEESDPTPHGSVRKRGRISVKDVRTSPSDVAAEGATTSASAHLAMSVLDSSGQSAQQSMPAAASSEIDKIKEENEQLRRMLEQNMLEKQRQAQQDEENLLLREQIELLKKALGNK